MAASKKRTQKKDSLELEKQPAVPGEESPQEGQEELKADLLDDFLFNAANYIYVRRKLFGILAAIVLAVMVSVYGGFKYLERQDNLRNEQLFQIEKIIFNAELSETEQLNEATPLLDSFITEHEGSTQYHLAVFYRAGLRFKQGELSVAEQDLKLLLSTLEPGSDLYVLANLYLVNALRDQKKSDEALEVLQAVKTEAKTDAMIDIVLMEQAELYMSKDQSDKAKEVLQVLLKDYPKSLYSGKAKQLLEFL